MIPLLLFLAFQSGGLTPSPTSSACEILVYFDAGKRAKVMRTCPVETLEAFEQEQIPIVVGHGDPNWDNPIDVPAIQKPAKSFLSETANCSDSGVCIDGMLVCTNHGVTVSNEPFEHRCKDGWVYGCADPHRGLWSTEAGREDYISLMMRLGSALIFDQNDPVKLRRDLELGNRLNEGNPNYTPYQAEKK